MSQRANGCACLRFRANDGAIRRPAQEGRLDERIENALARGGIEAKKPAGLSRRQPQTGHLIEFGSDPQEQCGEVHTTPLCKGCASRYSSAESLIYPAYCTAPGYGRGRAPNNRVAF